MAHYDFMVLLQGDSGLPRDRFINTLHFDTGTLIDTVEDVADELWTKYDTVLKPLLSGLSTAAHRIKAYEAGPAPRQPVLDKAYSFTTGLSAGKMPQEVALCLSYAAEDNPDNATDRRRGRIYLGPISTAYGQNPRPDSTARDIALDFGEAIATIGLASNTTWEMYSRLDNTYRKIESIWCDDAWDTQRRRGLAPTMREVRDVQ